MKKRGLMGLLATAVLLAGLLVPSVPVLAAAPVAVDDAYSTDEDTALSVSASGVLGNDTGVGLSVQSCDDSALQGALTWNADGSFTYDPNGEFDGLADGESATETFTYNVTDGETTSNDATVTITVTGENDPRLRAAKTADPRFAAPGETVTYTILVANTGDCTLGVWVDDDMLGIHEYFRLPKQSRRALTGDYEVSCHDPWVIENTAYVRAIHSQGRLPVIEREAKVLTIAARTIGYWKNHGDDWCCCWGETSIFSGKDYDDLNMYFPGMGAEEDGVNPLEMLRAQLIAAELNYCCFNDTFCYMRPGVDITGTMRRAEALLAAAHAAAGGWDLDAWWSDLSKKLQKRWRQAAQPLKDELASFNEIGDWHW